MRYVFPLISLLTFVSFDVRADYGDWALRDMYRGARSTGMGGAHIAIADDEEALFLNPAGLAAVDRAQIHYLDAFVEGSVDAYAAYTKSSSAFSSFSASSLNELMGKNIYGRAQITPTYVMQGFGFALLLDGQVALLEKNQALPQITLGYQMTNGFQAGMAFNLLGNAKRPRRSKIAQPELRVGMAGKFLWRRGGYRIMPTGTLFQLSRGPSLITGIMGNYHYGIGMDLGTQYSMPIGPQVTFSVGAAFLDVGDTNFGDDSPGPQTQMGNFGIGTAIRYDTGSVAQFTFAYDHRNIFNDTDWRLRNHFGLEIDFVNMSIYGGYNGVYLTYGFGFNAWLLRITANSYAEELGAIAHQDGNRRYQLRLDLKFTL
ncbi:MAG: hypothetical protein AB7P04_14730 [Bacteriovoracia bacterium]